MTLYEDMFEAQKARVLALWEKWKVPLYLAPWTVHNGWNDGPPPGSGGGSEIAECAAKTHVDWPYLEATVEWHVPYIAQLDDEKLEYIFLHECMHILLNEMREDAEGGMHHEERVAALLGKIIQKLAPSEEA